VFVAISYLVSSLFAGIIDQSILIQSAVSGLIFVVLMVILISVRRRRSR
jgi:membrane associated rhomboid family serine protease